MNKFLTKLDIFSTTLGGDKYVTSSVLMPVIASMKKMMQEDSSDPLYIARMKQVNLQDFNRRIAKNIETDFFLMATALDPRWKDLKMIKRHGWMGFLLNKRRLCLSGESVNMQLFLKDNLEL